MPSYSPVLSCLIHWNVVANGGSLALTCPNLYFSFILQIRELKNFLEKPEFEATPMHDIMLVLLLNDNFQ